MPREPEDGGWGSKLQYKPVDSRAIHQLNPVVTVDELRKAGVVSAQGPTSSLACPGLSPHFLDNSDSDDDTPRSPRTQQSQVQMGSSSSRPTLAALQPVGSGYNATLAARAQLLHEKPGVVERMEKGVAICSILKDNRSYRLNSLGVFQPEVNDVRTRSMHRVELHKHLSTTNLRAPQGQKQVKSAVAVDTVSNRLERMYGKVLRSLDDTSNNGAGSGQAAGTGGRAGRGQMGSVGGAGAGKGRALAVGGGGSMHLVVPQQQQQGEELAGGAGRGVGGGDSPATRSPSRAHLSPAPAAHQASSPSRLATSSPGAGGALGPPLSPLRQLASSPSISSTSPTFKPGRGAQLPGGPFSPGNTGNLGACGGQHSAEYWSKVALPPEVLEAQLEHIAEATQAHLEQYHAAVAAAQDALLAASGLTRGSLGIGDDKLELHLKKKLGQIQDDTVEHNFNYSTLSKEAVLASKLSEASKKLLTANKLPNLIQAALDHVAEHKQQYEQLRVTKDVKEERRKKRSIPMRGQAGAAAAGGPGGEASAYSMAASTAIHGDLSFAPDPYSLLHGGAWPHVGPDGTTYPDGGDPDGEWGDYEEDDEDGEAEGGELGNGEWSGWPQGGGSGAGLDPSAAALSGLAKAPTMARGGAGPSRAATARAATLSRAGRSMTLGRALTARSTMGRGGLGQGAGDDDFGPLGHFTNSSLTDEHMEYLRDQLMAAEEDTSKPPDVWPLPALPQGDMDAGTYVRARLERVWAVLDMPPPMRLDMVLHFTRRERALQFAKRLELWEDAAAAVAAREAQVEQLVDIQRQVEAGEGFRLSVGHVERTCAGVLRLTAYVAALAERVQREAGWTLTRSGQPYPGEAAISADHLLVFMEQLRQATEATGMLP